MLLQCVKELQDKAQYLQHHSVIHVLDIRATFVKADLDAEDDFCQRLSQAVHPLESILDAHRDWHPGSDGLVPDLVHPSLFPLQYGKSRVILTGGVGILDCAEYSASGSVCTIPVEVSEDKVCVRDKSWGGSTSSLKAWGSYQWLPTDVGFRQDGTASIAGYMNNLHLQHHSELYQILEQAVDKALPLWNECLSWFHDRTRIKVNSCGHEDFRPPSKEGTRGDVAVDGEVDDIPEDEDEDSDRAMADWVSSHPDEREMHQPHPSQAFVPFEERIKICEQNSTKAFKLSLS